MSDLADRLAALLRSGLAADLHGVVVLHHGSPVLEHYGEGPDFALGTPLGRVTFGSGTLHDIRSVTKSVVGLLYGIALADGLVPHPGEPLLRHFPEYPDLAADPSRAPITVEHALTMTLGLEWNEDAPYTSPANSEIAMELAPDRHRFVLERPIVEAPGKRWSYSGGAAALVGRLIVRGSGQRLDDFARERLFGPLGITELEWMAGDDGVALAASGLRLTPRGLARIGQAALGEPGVIPADWLGTALQAHVPLDEHSSYGYLWYQGAFSGGEGPRWVAGMGNGGQRLFVLPDHDLVVAITAGGYDAADQWVTPTTIMDQVVLPGLR